MLEKVKKNVFILLLIAVLFYIIVSILNDFGSVISSLKKFNWLILPVLFALSLLIFLTRFYKWNYYLNLLGVKISLKNSLAIYSTNLVMLATPGALGELFKSYLLKKITKEPISKTAPIIFAERTTDFIALISIAYAGSIFYDYENIIIIILSLFLACCILFISSKSISLKLLYFLSKLKFFQKYLKKISAAYESLHIMLKGKALFYMLLISLISWIIECFSFYLVLSNVQIDIQFFLSGFIYTFGMLMGSITMLPGGIGITDASIIFLITEMGYHTDNAITAAFIIRAVTLWFAVAVGFISIFYYKNLFDSFEPNS